MTAVLQFYSTRKVMPSHLLTGSYILVWQRGQDVLTAKSLIVTPGTEFTKLRFCRKLFLQMFILKFWTNFHPKTTYTILLYCIVGNT
jgi:hypothetical protein